MSRSVLFTLIFISAIYSHSAISTGQDLLFEAENSFYDKNYAAALEKLDSYLALSPDDLGALTLKARILVNTGDATQAIEIFEKALQLGADINLFALELARARNAANHFKENIKTIQPERFANDVAAELYAEKGFSYLGENENLMAEQAFSKAIALSPQSADAITGRATLALLKDNFPEAVSLLEVVISKNPYHHRSLMTLAQLEHSRNNLEKAKQHYQAAFNIKPLDTGTVIGLAGTLTDLKQHQQALTMLEQAIKEQPWVPHLYYLIYINHLKTGNTTEAQNALTKAADIFDSVSIQDFNRYPEELLLAAVVFKESGNIQKSLRYSSKFLESNPAHYGANKLNAALLLATGNYRQAISKLQGIAKYNSNDASVYTAMGDAYLGAKLYPTAIKNYKEALFIEPDSPQIHQRLAFSFFISHDNTNALKHLKLSMDNMGKPNLLFLALVQHSAGNNSLAQEAVDQFIRQYPDNLLAKNIKAAIALNKKQFPVADELLTSILQQAPENLVASINMATTLRYQRNFKASDTILLDLPQSPETLYALALNADNQGDHEEAIRMMLRINLSGQRNLKWSLYLLDLYIKAGQLDQATNSFQNINQYFSRNPLLMMRLANIEWLLNKKTGAKAALKAATTNTGYNSPILYSIAWQQTTHGFYKDAIYSLNKALVTSPQDHNLLNLLARTQILSGEFAAALKTTRRLFESHPDSLTAKILLADIEYSKGNYTNALAEYHTLLKAHQKPELVISAARSYQRLNQTDKAIQFLKKWNETIQHNALIKWQLARYLLLENEKHLALKVFMELEELLPEDAMVFNNIASLLTDTDISKAESYASKALQLKTDHAQLIDTYGWILLKKGEKSEALRLLRDAVSRDNSSSLIHYHLAVALQENDKNSEALKHLKIALKGKLELPILKDASKRMQQLTGKSS